MAHRILDHVAVCHLTVLFCAYDLPAFFLQSTLPLHVTIMQPLSAHLCQLRLYSSPSFVAVAAA